MSTSTVTGMPCCRGDLRRTRHGRGVVPVDVKQSRAGDLLRRDLLRVDAEAIGAAPQDGSLTGRVVDQNVGALIGAILPKLDVVEVDALTEQALHLDAARARRRRPCRCT